MAPNGASKRPTASSAAPRVIPAIPHALNRSARDKQSAAAQATSSVRPADANNKSPTQAAPVQEQSSKTSPVTEPKPVSIHDEDDSGGNALVAPVSETESASNAPPAETVAPDVDVDQAAQGSVSHLPPSVPAAAAPPVDSSVAPQLDVNGIKETSKPASVDVPAGSDAPSPTSQRHVRDLPPPFYPAAQPSGPPSATSIQVRHEQQAPGQHAHQPRMGGAANMTFGGYRDAANSSPALVPPQSQSPIYPHYAAGPPHGQPPYPTPAHAYHVSDPTAASPYSPGFSPAPQGYGYARDYSNNMAPQHPRSYQQQGARLHQPPRRPLDHHMTPRYPHPSAQNMYSGPYVPVRPVDPHGVETSKGPNSDGMPARSYMMNNRFAEQQPAAPSDPRVSSVRPAEAPGAPRTETSAITQYLRGQFGNAEFADCVVQLSHSGYLFPPTMLPAHGVILARSPKLRSLITMQHGNSSNAQNDPKQLSVPISDRFLNFEIALMKALMRLYGEPLPERDVVARLAGPSAYLEAGNVHAVQMRFALAYSAAGHFLQMDEIISHGLHLAESLLGWDTIGKALAFGLEGGLSASFAQFDTPTKDKGSNSSVDDTPAKLDSPSAAPAYGYYSDRMLSSIVSFLVYNCPPAFALWAGAPQMNDPPRLPADAEPQHTRSASRLNQIRFGEMAVDSTSSQDPASEQMSSILLSLPFPLLAHVLESNILGERLGWARVGAIMKDVVRERELRRQRAMKNLGASTPASAVEERLWRTVRWVESVETSEQRPSGLKLARQVAGGGGETPSAGSVAAS